MFLTKSDFKTARTCGTKLYYQKLGYPSTQDDNPYLEFLADGGFMVEAIARVLFPDGRDISAKSQEAEFSATKRALKKNDVTLFQATLIYEKLLAQVDILEKRGNKFRLIEVKAKSVEPVEDGRSPFRGARGRLTADWVPYLEDVAFQTHVLRSLYPDAEVTPCLCAIDKSQTSTHDTDFHNFQITPRQKYADGQSSKPLIKYTGDNSALKNQPFIRIFDVTSEVNELLPKVMEAAAAFTTSLAKEKPIRIDPMLGVVCKKCEYRVDSAEQNGFRECWKKAGLKTPHLLDLYRVDKLESNLLTRLISQRKTRLLDLRSNNFNGKIGERQSTQLKWTRSDREYIDPQLPAMLSARKYPLHFLDFEASRLAVPYYAGMRPYGQVAFQWSCHTIAEPRGELSHKEWISDMDAYPNFDFARSLKDAVGRDGTVFVWSSFERSALKDIREQMLVRKKLDRSLLKWLETMIDKKGPLCDLYELAKAYYFHPDMKGSLSIKKVLPAVWFHNSHVRSHRWFSEYMVAKDNRILEPYETLPSLPFADAEDEDEADAVREGTGAIRTYQEMMFGARRNDTAFRATMKQRLLNYCKLDTAAMVMIWMHWTSGDKGARKRPR